MAQAQALLQRLLPHTGSAHRIGITGVPGVGKSTAIDQLGMNLVEQGHRVAVLAVDPTSTRTGGSILGDKTRMVRLAQSRAAFIRPSPTSGTLGGVARKTRETMLLVEAAGFDVVIVETVGVGQSEVAVAGMVDFFLVLLLAGGGDDLQGIKRGIIEIADMIAITKADGDNVARAKKAAAIYQGALGIITPTSPAWVPPVLTISAQDNRGLDEVWARILEHRERTTATGEFQARRGAQAVDWMHDLLQERLLAALEADASCGRAAWPSSENEVRAGARTPALAVGELVEMVGPATMRPEVRDRAQRSWRGGPHRARPAGPHTTVLMTGFGPFPGVPVNATMRLLPELARAAALAFPDARFVTEVLPTEWVGAPRRLAAVIAEVEPDLALHFGVSSRARGFEIEQRAHNSLPANAGCVRRAAAGCHRARGRRRRAARQRCPCRTSCSALQRRGIPAYVSRDAGAYLCNAVLYHSLQIVRGRGPRLPGRLRACAGDPGAAGRSQSRQGRRLPADLAAGRGRRPGDHRRLPRPPAAQGQGAGGRSCAQAGGRQRACASPARAILTCA